MFCFVLFLFYLFLLYFFVCLLFPDLNCTECVVREQKHTGTTSTASITFSAAIQRTSTPSAVLRVGSWHSWTQLLSPSFPQDSAKSKPFPENALCDIVQGSQKLQSCCVELPCAFFLHAVCIPQFTAMQPPSGWCMCRPKLSCF